MKRDDLSAREPYGGNKVRKLEHFFADARALGRSRIVTLGAAGSHQVVATAVFGRREGFAVDAVLVPQPGSEHARDNLRAAIAHGLVVSVASSWPMAPALVASRLGRDAYLVPLGGSNALGSLGFVEAARELAAQIEAGELPEPDVVVVACGSGGTAAGLAVGFEALGLKSRVTGVIISPPHRVLAAIARRLVKKTAARVGLSRGASERAVARLDLEPRFLGDGYARTTPEGTLAIALAGRAGLVVDGTYTAKALACAVETARARPDARILFWHTLSSAPMGPLLSHAPDLPADLAALFQVPRAHVSA